MKILLLSDIHANFPVIEAIEQHLSAYSFDLIINCGDSLVYGPFPNETLEWLKKKKTISILGNTDKKVIKLLKGKTFAKPSRSDKRIMYTWTAENLTAGNCSYLMSMKKKRRATVPGPLTSLNANLTIGIFHGSPARHHEFLFESTPDERFIELAKAYPKFKAILCGHSHSPFHKLIDATHFINPGSAGRMFDGDPRASCATLNISDTGLSVEHHRVEYDIDKTVSSLRSKGLPDIYCTMYKSGRKIN